MIVTLWPPPTTRSGARASPNLPRDIAKGRMPTPARAAIGYVLAGWKVPSPLPMRTDTSLDAELAVTRARMPFGVRSAAASEKVPVLVSGRPGEHWEVRRV